MAASDPSTLTLAMGDRWLKLGNAWVKAKDVESVLEEGDRSEVRLRSGMSYPSPYSAYDTLVLLSEEIHDEQ